MNQATTRTKVITAEQAIPLAHLSTEQIVKLPAKELHEAYANLQILQSMAKSILDRFHAALEQRYAEQARSNRIAQGRDFGVSHLVDGPVRVTNDLPKRVDWDQAQLAQIAQRIAACGENIEDYVDIDYSIPESRYTAWPATLKESFAKARTVKPGKATYRLSMQDESIPPGTGAR